MEGMFVWSWTDETRMMEANEIDKISAYLMYQAASIASTHTRVRCFGPGPSFQGWTKEDAQAQETECASERESKQ